MFTFITPNKIWNCWLKFVGYVPKHINASVLATKITSDLVEIYFFTWRMLIYLLSQIHITPYIRYHSL